MSDLMSIGSSAVKVYQRALGTVSNNIANLDSEGYTRRLSSVEELTPRMEANAAIGTGSFFSGVERAYDSFLEASVRDAASELGEKDKLAVYAKRILDLFGNDDATLSSALDDFFASSKNVAADPASLIRRQEMLADAETLARRFNDLYAQMQTIDTESSDDLQGLLSDVNQKLEQLGIVNKELLKKGSLEKQSPDILDQRDLLLRELSELLPINVSFDKRGVVKVSGTSSMTSGILVDGREAYPIDIVRTADGKRELVIDPFQRAETIPVVATGEVGGILVFQETLWTNSVRALDQLALTLNEAVNETHFGGVDLYGEIGGDFFEIAPVFDIDQRGTTSPLNISLEVTDPDQFQGDPMRLDYTTTAPGVDDWVLVNTRSGDTYAANGAARFDVEGLSISISGTARPSDSVALNPIDRPSAGIRLAIDDPKRVAASGFFRVIEDAQNRTDALATLAYQSDSLTDSELNNLTDIFGETAYLEQTVPRDATFAEPLGFIEAGSSDVTLSNRVDMDGVSTIQVFTREGRHLLGNELGSDDVALLINEANGFESTATYSTDYLHKTGSESYKDLSYHFGLRANGDRQIFAQYQTNSTTGERVRFDTARVIPAQLVGEPVPLKTGVGIAAGALTLQGMDLPELKVDSNKRVTAETMAVWLRGSGASEGLDISFLGEVVFDVPDFSDSSLPGLHIHDGTDELELSGSDVTSTEEFLAALNAMSNISAVEIAGGQIRINILNGKHIDIRGSKPANVSDPINPAELNMLGIPSGTQTSRLVIQHNIGTEAEVSLDLNSLGVNPDIVINDTTVDLSDATTLSQVVDAINRANVDGVVASEQSGKLILTSDDRRDISVGTETSGLITGVSAVRGKTPTGNGDLTSPYIIANDVTDAEIESSTIEFGITEKGSSADLGLLGLRAESYIDGVIDEDLLVFATPNAGSNATVPGSLGFAATLEQDPDFVIEDALRARQLDFSIVQDASEGQYEVRSFIFDEPIVTDDEISIVFGEDATKYPAKLEDDGKLVGANADLPLPMNLAYDFVNQTLIVTSYTQSRVLMVIGEVKNTTQNQISTPVTEASILDETAVGPLQRGEIPSEYGVYEIKDVATETVLGEGQWPESDQLAYRGLTITLSEQPLEGDSFFVDGNNLGVDGTFDAQGNNENMLRLVDLETDETLFNDGRTLSEKYISIVSEIGNRLTQSEISKTAMKAVYDQAIEARNEVSGVSLDEEAADLVRFQQAYQASAQVMQTAVRLFDTIIGIR